ncbi:MAG TPA: WS/DGAT domain-containing protein, partial [Saprospiraceae bacterium]|nr:WS/DGAT domain-containing protein [Saprospiraceae bacterium]
VMTNVPGSPEPLYLAGSQITEWMFWVPQSGSVGMGVSIITYGGHVHFGLITDRKRVSDPEMIIRRFGDEFEKLVLMTMMGPWGQELDPDKGIEFIEAQARPSASLPADVASP